MSMWWPVVRCQSSHHQEKASPVRKDITIAWLADSFRALIEKSMSICASSSPGCLPARLKSPNEAWSRYLIPDSLSQSDFAAEVIHPSRPWRWVQHEPCTILLMLFLLAFCCFQCLVAFWHAALPLSMITCSHTYMFYNMKLPTVHIQTYKK